MNGYSIGGSDARHSKHVVERLSGLLGEEEARVVVAGALHLNGAMIAAAQRDENGKYNDHGNLVLKVGELFWQHIYDYDNGHTLGMSYSKSFGKKAESEGQAEGKDVWHLGGVVGGHDKDGVTKATIGLGDVTIGGSKEVPEGINRYVNFVQEMQTNYDVQPIKPHFTNQDIQTLIDGLKRKEDGSFDLGATISSISERAYETVAVPLSEAADYLFPEKKQQLNDEDYGTRLVKAAGLDRVESSEEDQGSKDEDYDDGVELQNIEAAKKEIMNVQYVSEADKAEAIERLDEIPSLVNKIEGRTALKAVASELDEFITKYPWAADAIAAVSIGIKVLNLPAFAAAIANEVKGRMIGEAAGPVIELAVTQAAISIKKFDNTLSDREALALAGAALAAVGVIGDAKSIIKSVKGIFAKINMGKGLSYVTPDGMKLDADDFESKFDHILYKDRTDLPESVKKVGDRYPINADKAGNVYHIKDLPDSIKAKIKLESPDFDIKYPDGVRFDLEGFPDFGPYATHTVKLEKFKNYDSDFKRADELAKNLDPNILLGDKRFTWHHHQDGRTMQRVPRDLHNAFKHTGGMSTTKHGV